MENYAITRLEDRVSRLENEVRRIEIEARPKSRVLPEGFFSNIATGVGFGVICGGAGLALAKLIKLLIEA